MLPTLYVQRKNKPLCGRKKKYWLKKAEFTLLILPKSFDPDVLSYLPGALDSQYAAG